MFGLRPAGNQEKKKKQPVRPMEYLRTGCEVQIRKTHEAGSCQSKFRAVERIVILIERVVVCSWPRWVD
jgi:hypothetical protein